MNNYEKIVRDNLDKLYQNIPENLENCLPANRSGHIFWFSAFGKKCRVDTDGIFLDNEKQTGPLAIIISLYILNARPDNCVVAPLKAFKDFSGSMPYVSAFTTHTEQILAPMVSEIKHNQEKITELLDGRTPPTKLPGDFSLMVFPLPKIALCYIFYEADEDFPAGVTCLYSHNASFFIPIDGLADVGEYTSKEIINLLD